MWLRGRYTESVEGGDAISRDHADVAEHGSGEAVTAYIRPSSSLFDVLTHCPEARVG